MTASGRMPRRTISGNTSAALPSRPTEIGFPALCERSTISSASSIERRLGVEVAGLQPELDAARLALDGDHRGAGQGRGERLRAAHAAEAAGQDPFAREGAAEVLAAHLGEGLVGALHDALGADVDPRAGRHLAVHHQALPIELVEVLPGGVGGHQIGVGDQDARRILVGAENADRLSRLHQQRLVVVQGLQRGDDAGRTIAQSRAARPMPP